jgi:MFS family permease
MFLSHPVADALGRRYAALTGTGIVTVGTAFEAGATAPGAYAMMIIGRIVSGIGVAIISTSVPLYQRLVIDQCL